jgi:hypothetical protein
LAAQQAGCSLGGDEPPLAGVNGGYPRKAEWICQIVVQNLHFSAKWASIKQKCGKLRPKCLFLFGHCVLRSFVFIHIPASNVQLRIPFLLQTVCGDLFCRRFAPVSSSRP